MPELSFESTEIFRNSLISRNLPPYSVDGVFSPPPPPYVYEFELNDFSVIDQPDELIDDNPFGIELSALNRFNPEGGMNNETAMLSDLNLGPNTGEYSINDAFLLENSESLLDSLGLNNIYTAGAGYDEAFTTTISLPAQPSNLALNPYIPYWSPPSFRASTYSPYSLLIDPLTIGSDGSLADDSDLARNSAASFREMMRFRLQQNIFTETAGRLNFLDALVEPTEWINILDGTHSLIEENYQITVPQSLVGKGVDFLGRLEGLYYPSSTIPGDYFGYTERNGDAKTGVGKIISKIGNFFGFSRPERNPSQLFIDNTGVGQKKQIAKALKINKYRPTYVTNTAENPVGLVSRFLGVRFPAGNYYIGNDNAELTFLSSPPGQVPLDSEGNETDTIVYGPDVFAKSFEGDTIVDSSEDGIVTDIVWTSDKFSDNAGFTVGKKGEKNGEDSDFIRISSEFNEKKSSLKKFKEGSILDQTQKIINSQPNNANRFSHVGNAIEQISKVFNDGYKEITKGSRVIKYVTEGNVEKGMEYGRVFTRDVQYSTFSKLQKTDGNIRKFNNSVLDNTYNLNIVPLNGDESTNILRGSGFENGGNVKKYLFSIENLAWRTSSKSGYRVEDLPISERGPNGGRIMWFPPYDLTFNESIKPNFKEHLFLGRPEPIYTYGSTTRSGTLSWKIIVDHPSILNVIVNKSLSNEKDKKKIDSLLESFFSGCKKYDIYELAARYPNIPVSELSKMQDALNSNNTSKEEIRDIYKNTSITEGSTPDTTSTNDTLEIFRNFRFYFPTSINSSEIVGSKSYDLYYNEYMNQLPQSNLNASNFIRGNVEPSLVKFNDFIKALYFLFKNNENAIVTINFKSTPSSINSLTPGDDLNTLFGTLSQDKADSVKNYFLKETIEYGDEVISLKEYINSNKIRFKGESEIETEVNTEFNSFNCINSSSDNNSQNELAVMACNSSRISDIKVENINNTNPITIGTETNVDNVNSEISKKLLRSLFNESDYFKMIKETDPFIYETISEKIKFFQPIFHSTTPEGLNSRLTFLQQCALPGETIPIIGIDGELKQTDALNTSFGVPPVLILRVGDFFHTKIIPTTIGITYEGLDINPEGIGVQPMVAKITMGFNFIGGQGLKEPIQKLQNAISFNFYGNTEMYDERAEATEDISSLLKTAMDNLKGGFEITNGPIEENQILNDGGETIGEIENSVQTGGTETGILSYDKIMDEQKTKIKTYFGNSVEFAERMINEYNEGILSLYLSNRRYVDGKIGGKDARLIGKSKTISELLDKRFNDFIKIIENKEITIFETFGNNIPSNDIRKFIENYKNYIIKKKSSFSSRSNEILGALIKSEETLIKSLNKTNFIFNEKFDGKIIKKDEVKAFKLKVNEPNFENFNNNLKKMADDVDEFYEKYKNTIIKSEVGLFIPSSSNFNASLNSEDQLEYLLFSNDILNNIEHFINDLSLNCSNGMKEKIRSYYTTSILSAYKEEQKEELKTIELLKISLDNYINYSPTFPSEENYKISYKASKVSSSEKKSLLELYDLNNHGGKDLYNKKVILL